MRLVERLKEFKGEDYCFTPTDIAYGDWDGIKFVAELELDEHRWTRSMLTIVDFDGKLYGIEWDRGLTEIQENEFYPSDSTIYEVDKIEKVVYTYTKKAS